jgi:hypothetical protein
MSNNLLHELRISVFVGAIILTVGCAVPSHAVTYLLTATPTATTAFSGFTVQFVDNGNNLLDAGDSITFSGVTHTASGVTVTLSTLAVIGAPAWNLALDDLTIGGYVSTPCYGDPGQYGSWIFANCSGATLLEAEAGAALRGSNWNYEMTRLDAVPLPAALPLFATGLGVMSLLGWRRKRKKAGAVTTS